jgi:hypothetical protein
MLRYLDFDIVKETKKKLISKKSGSAALSISFRHRDEDRWPSCSCRPGAVPRL